MNTNKIKNIPVYKLTTSYLDKTVISKDYKHSSRLVSHCKTQFQIGPNSVFFFRFLFDMLGTIQ